VKNHQKLVGLVNALLENGHGISNIMLDFGKKALKLPITSPI
jgi:hypothetical protein